jgi:citrate lyase subunit beta/citryl-CoA lyase
MISVRTSGPLRSLLYVPGNSPSMVQNCMVLGADAVILDLEDAVALTEKDAARSLVRHALETLDFMGTTVFVRVNGADTPFFKEDIRAIVPARPDGIRLPKTDGADDVLRADALMTRIEREAGLPEGSVVIQAMVETARSLLHAYDVASASPRVSGISIGGQDFAADLGIRRTRDGGELLYARAAIVAAAKAAGVDAFDTVFTDVNDCDGLFADAAAAANMGFSGKAAIHPSQVAVIHRAFRPEEKEVRKASRVVRAAREAEERGVGVIAVDGRMVDAPVVAQARRTIELARIAGMEVPTE